MKHIKILARTVRNFDSAVSCAAEGVKEQGEQWKGPFASALAKGLDDHLRYEAERLGADSEDLNNARFAFLRQAQRAEMPRVNAPIDKLLHWLKQARDREILNFAADEFGANATEDLDSQDIFDVCERGDE